MREALYKIFNVDHGHKGVRLWLSGLKNIELQDRKNWASGRSEGRGPGFYGKIWKRSWAPEARDPPPKTSLVPRHARGNNIAAEGFFYFLLFFYHCPRMNVNCYLRHAKIHGCTASYNTLVGLVTQDKTVTQQLKGCVLDNFAFSVIYFYYF